MKAANWKIDKTPKLKNKAKLKLAKQKKKMFNTLRKKLKEKQINDKYRISTSTL